MRLEEALLARQCHSFKELGHSFKEFAFDISGVAVHKRYRSMFMLLPVSSSLTGLPFDSGLVNK